jgi:hypothetical protein
LSQYRYIMSQYLSCDNPDSGASSVYG